MATLKGGYDFDFVEPPAKRLECAVCLLVVCEPHVITCCGNHFCRSCIERVQRDVKPCPLCNDSDYSVFYHKGVTREVNELRVRCPHKERGCEWEGPLGDASGHLDDDGGCGFVEVGCVYKCGGRFLRKVLREHERNACHCRPVEIVLASIMKKLDQLTAENQEIKVENRKLKDELTKKIEVENQKLKDELTDVRGQLQESQQQCKQLYTEVEPQAPDEYGELVMSKSQGFEEYGEPAHDKSQSLKEYGEPALAQEPVSVYASQLEKQVSPTVHSSISSYEDELSTVRAVGRTPASVPAQFTYPSSRPKRT